MYLAKDALHAVACAPYKSKGRGACYVYTRDSTSKDFRQLQKLSSPAASASVASAFLSLSSSIAINVADAAAGESTAQASKHNATSASTSSTEAVAAASKSASSSESALVSASAFSARMEGTQGTQGTQGDMFGFGGGVMSADGHWLVICSHQNDDKARDAGRCDVYRYVCGGRTDMHVCLK